MPLILLFPIVPFIIWAGVIFYWLFVGGLLWSGGDVIPMTTTTLPTLQDSSWFSTAFGSASTSAVPTVQPYVTYEEATAAGMTCDENPYCRYDLNWNDTIRYMFLYHLFGLLWTNQFLVGFGYVVIALAISSYYWTRGERTAMPKNPVWNAVSIVSRFHLGRKHWEWRAGQQLFVSCSTPYCYIYD